MACTDLNIFEFGILIAKKKKLYLDLKKNKTNNLKVGFRATFLLLGDFNNDGDAKDDA